MSQKRLIISSLCYDILIMVPQVLLIIFSMILMSFSCPPLIYHLAMVLRWWVVSRLWLSWFFLGRSRLKIFSWNHFRWIFPSVRQGLDNVTKDVRHAETHPRTAADHRPRRRERPLLHLLVVLVQAHLQINLDIRNSKLANVLRVRDRLDVLCILPSRTSLKSKSYKSWHNDVCYNCCC